MASESLKQAQDKVQQLLEAAEKGMIIPIRLPGQVEEIVNLLKQAEREHTEEVSEIRSAAPADMEGYMEEEAYFVGHAVHELRTPMTSIRGYADMLGNPAMGQVNDMQKQFIEVIRNNAKRMEGLLTDVSHANKIRKRTLKIAKKMDMFKNIAMRVEKDMGALAEELNRQLEFDVPQGLPLLNTDGELFAVVLNKLVENALRYSAEGEGKVTVSAVAEGNMLVVKVQDNGIGMSPEDQARLGEIYFRSDHDAVREYKGSGLGIPIAYGIMDMLGGSIEVESALDQGTTFTIKMEGMG